MDFKLWNAMDSLEKVTTKLPPNIKHAHLA